MDSKIRAERTGQLVQDIYETANTLEPLGMGPDAHTWPKWREKTAAAIEQGCETTKWIVGEVTRMENEVVEINAKLVSFIVQRFASSAGRSESADWLVGAAQTAMLEASWTYPRDQRESTWASWVRVRMNSHVERAFNADYSPVVRFPEDRRRDCVKVARAQSMLGGEPTVEEIAEATGLSASSVERAIQTPIPKTRSIPTPSGETALDSDEWDPKVRDLSDEARNFQSDDSSNPDAMAANSEVRDTLEVAFRMIPSDHAEALRLYYGLDGCRRTMREVGEAMNLPASRISTLLQEAQIMLTQGEIGATLGRLAEEIE
jgi:RNA polymerase sigma factor (sigma-70 family)